MAEMLCDCPDKGVLPLVPGQRGRFLDARAATDRIGVGIEFVEESDNVTARRVPATQT